MLRSLKILLVTLTLILLSAGRVWAVCPAGDLSRDCEVDFEDVLVFAEQWLSDGGCEEPNCADLNGVEGVNMFDFALLTQNWRRVGNPLVINEFMASNSKFAADPQGQYDDWLEIYNAGDETIDVGGMYLTDNLDDPARWRIPEGTTIAPHGYLLIWADNDLDDNGSVASGLHAGFELNAGGDEIGLFDSNGTTLIDSIAFGKQTSDISYGRYPDGSLNWRFLGIPTLIAENDGAYIGEVADPQFSHKRGFYDAPFSAAIATETKGAMIYYTVNGEEPYAAGRIIVGSRYTAPIPINTTTFLRARAFKPGWKPSRIKTHTYILNASNTMKSLPVVSLVGNAEKTFYEPTGIMAIVGGYYSGGVWVSDGPTSYNNPMRHGMAFERPVSFEFFNRGDESMQTDCGIRVHGSDWMRPRYKRCDGYWTYPCKFSFRLYFRGRYGENELEYPLFPYGQDRFKSIVLRGGHNDMVNPFIKDELLRRLHMDMGNAASTGTHANLFINGEYKGYFNPCEHIKDSFCQGYYNSEYDWDVMTMSGIRDGDSVAWNEMIAYARNHDLSESVHYREISRRLDIAVFADYLILQLWSGNWDWPQNNWSAARERSDEGKWRFFIWDAEGGMFSNRLNTVYFDRLNLQNNANGWLYRSLKVSKDFRQTFADRIYKHFYNNGAMTEANIRSRFFELRDEVLGVIPNMNMYVLNTWVPNRLSIFLSACSREDMFTFTGPMFKINGVYQHGGYASIGDAFSITNPHSVGTVYYTVDGSDPRVPTTSEVTGTTLVAKSDPKRVLVPTEAISDNWRGGGAFADSGWTEVTGSPGGVGYDERIDYHPYISLDVEDQMNNKRTSCYVRIPFHVDAGELAGFNFMTLKAQYDDGFVAYINGDVVHRMFYTGDPAWNSHADGNHEASGAFESFDISDDLGTVRSGDNILAIHAMNNSAGSSDFLIAAELIAGRISSSGSGISPTAIKYTGPRTLTGTTEVKARVLSGSIWSALNEATYAVGPVAESLRITEIMYHPQDTNDPGDANEEFVELTNIGPDPINVNLVRFTNGIDFTFGDLELAKDGLVVVVKNQAAFDAQYPGFSGLIAGEYTGSLDNGGERIELQDAVGQTILNFRYNDGWRRITDGRGFSLTIIDATDPDPNSWDEKDFWRASAYFGGSPGSDDNGIIPNPGAIVINELLARSHRTTTDWIELYNTSDAQIDIGGWYLSDSNANLMKYRIADGTEIDSGKYLVFYKDANFGEVSTDPGKILGFALSENGGAVYLSSAEGNVLMGYREAEDFGASATDHSGVGVSFGRYFKRSTGNYNFVAMSVATPRLPNAYPKVGPIVINEIMYHPKWPPGSSYPTSQYEYIELFNSSAAPVKLYDDEAGEPWRFTDGIEFTFPDWPNEVTIPAGGYLLVVKDMTAYLAQYGLPPFGVPVLGPYDGKLSNGGEKLELSMPGDVDEDDTRYYIRIDRVNYSDGSHPDNCPGGVDLWPTEPDGGGASLSRIDETLYGNDPNNWKMAGPTPGLQNP